MICHFEFSRWITFRTWITVLWFALLYALTPTKSLLLNLKQTFPERKYLKTVLNTKTWIKSIMGKPNNSSCYFQLSSLSVHFFIFFKPWKHPLNSCIIKKSKFRIHTCLHGCIIYLHQSKPKFTDTSCAPHFKKVKLWEAKKSKYNYNTNELPNHKIDRTTITQSQLQQERT